MVWSTKHDTPPQSSEEYASVPPRQLVAGDANTFLEHYSELSINSAPATLRLTGIVCTIGPSSKDVETLESMIENGMNIVRIDCSQGSQENYLEFINNVREAEENCSKKLGLNLPVCIALDIKGPEIRTGFIDGGENAQIELKSGEQIRLSTDKAYFHKGNVNVIYVDYDNMPRVLQIGNSVYLDNGLIALRCTNIQGAIITCTIEIGGTLGSCKTVNLPGVAVDLPSVSEKDKDDLHFAIAQKVDLVFVSYIREAYAISELRNILGHEGSFLKIVAKIENEQGVNNIEEIIKAADGIMLGRGDLGIELPIEKLFLAQKSIIAKCNRAGRPIICANQLLDSMMINPRPTRAECADVANAVLDGADCVMLTGESARGNYPAETVQTMAKICKEAESSIWYKALFIELVSLIVPPIDSSHAVAISAVQAASKCQAAAIIVNTTSGHSAFLIAKYRPACPIIAITRNLTIARQTHLYRGVVPLHYTVDRLDDWNKDVDARISFGLSFGKWKKIIRSGDAVVTVHGSKKGAGYTDSLRILYVMKPAEGESCICDELTNK